MPKRTFPSPYNLRENNFRRRGQQPESDAGEVVAYCENCTTESRFVEQQRAKRYDTQGEEDPLHVREIVEGVTAWCCVACGSCRTDPMAEEGYEWEDTNQGYHVRNFPDEETTWRAPGDDVQTR